MTLVIEWFNLWLNKLPINWRYQGLATYLGICKRLGTRCFQSIGVIKDYRRLTNASALMLWGVTTFPFNRRHQGLATAIHGQLKGNLPYRSFHSIGVTKDWRRVYSESSALWGSLLFPFNRRHQGLATRDFYTEAARRIQAVSIQ